MLLKIYVFTEKGLQGITFFSSKHSFKLTLCAFKLSIESLTDLLVYITRRTSEMAYINGANNELDCT